MKNSKRKRAKSDSQGASLSIDALAELTSSDVVRQLKLGLSRLAPINGGESTDSPVSY